jgi:hypothetical protein
MHAWVFVCMQRGVVRSFMQCKTSLRGQNRGRGDVRTHLFEWIIVKLFLLSDQALLEHLLQ